MSLGETGWTALMQALSEDPAKASQKLEMLLNRIERLFVWRGCSEPQDAAHEVMQRVANKLARGAALTTDIGLYASGFVGPVFYEWLRDNQKEQSHTLEALDESALGHLEQREDVWLEHLSSCLKSSLTTDEQELLLQFHAYDGRRRVEIRQEMARLGEKSINALRIEAHRLRKRLQGCVEALFDAPH